MPKVMRPPTKILLEFEEWDIRETIESNGLSVICHRSCDWWTYFGVVRMTCPHCKQQIPDEVYGVWALHNWDDIHSVLVLGIGFGGKDDQ